ncbi:ABC transporter substrate-binding protein [Chelativorans sp.]|uniref:ABC transporter substrate-binding protein n=1 Tax=Chelativorans sp. TaxID=2203393 RepID=UPI002810DFCD|nr:ABC transporter substrate-binding protein [Chelativorans sp.]
MKRQTILIGALLLGPAAMAHGQELREVPRNRTLITQGWDYYNQVPAPSNYHPYISPLQNIRNVLHYTINEALFYTNHQTNEIIPWIAESFTYNDDFTEVTLKIRPDVKWSDGEALTAEDVAFTFEMLKGAAPDLSLSSTISEWVASVEATDAQTVVLKLSKPGPRWAQDTLATGQVDRFAVVPKHIWQDQDPKTFNNFDIAKGWPVGTGPFKLVKSDETSAVFDRRDSWWAIDAGLAEAMPAMERILYRPATADAMTQLFANSDIDIGRALNVGNLEAVMARNPNIVSWNESGPVWGTSAGCTWRVVFNNQVAPFDNPAVRKAIAAVFDREELADLAFEGSQPPAVLPFASYPGVVKYTSQLEEIIQESGVAEQDLARSEQLLTEAGFKKGADGKWQLPDGSAWPITITAHQGTSLPPVVTSQLQRAGFDAVFKASQDSAYFEALTAGDFQLATATECGSLYDPWQTLQHVHSKFAAQPGQKGVSVRAITRYSNPEMDALLDQMEARQPSPDDAEYMELVKSATRLMLEEMPQVTLIEELHAITFNTTYWTGFPSAADPYAAPYIAWNGFALVRDRLKPRE